METAVCDQIIRLLSYLHYACGVLRCRLVDDLSSVVPTYSTLSVLSNSLFRYAQTDLERPKGMELAESQRA